MMLRLLKTPIACLALLFSAQAIAMPVAPAPNVDFGTLTSGGTYSQSFTVPAGTIGSQAVAWYQFTLTGMATVTLDTMGSENSENGESNATSPIFVDTLLALYDDDAAGTLLEPNDDCTANSKYSCITRTLQAGTYLAAVTDSYYMPGYLYLPGFPQFDRPFRDGWDVDGREYETAFPVLLNVGVGEISVVPVPAAVWLFGTALLGFVGIARRTTVKS